MRVGSPGNKSQAGAPGEKNQGSGRGAWRERGERERGGQVQNSGSEQLFSKARDGKVGGAEGERHQVSPMSSKERAPDSYGMGSTPRLHPAVTGLGGELVTR